MSNKSETVIARIGSEINTTDSPMIIEGVASTSHLDFQGDRIPVELIELGYLEKNGFLNFHHRKDSFDTACIGEVLKANVIDLPNGAKGVKVQCKLHDNAVGRDIYNYMRYLKAHSDKRLGLSIEMTAIKQNGKIQSLIGTSLAITVSPANPHCRVDIRKSTDIDKPDKLPTVPIVIPTRGVTNAIHICKSTDSSEVAYLTEDFNMGIISNYFKSNENIEKEMNTATAAPITREALDGAKTKGKKKKERENRVQAWKVIIKGIMDGELRIVRNKK